MYGRITYFITKQSIDKLKNVKERVEVLRQDVKNNSNKLGTYNSSSDSNVDFENSNLKRILDDCEIAVKKANEFISLSNSNYWVKRETSH